MITRAALLAMAFLLAACSTRTVPGHELPVLTKRPTEHAAVPDAGLDSAPGDGSR